MCIRDSLTAALQRQVDAGRLQGWRAVSDSLPSLQRQQADRDLVIPAEKLARTRVAAMLGEPSPATTTAANASLQVEDGLRQPPAAPLRPAVRAMRDPSLPVEETTYSVSYTHLDVYKRQPHRMVLDSTRARPGRP